MYCVRNVTDDLYWVGANDHRLALFENVYPIPRGVTYNSYLLLDEKTVLFDTVDWSACRQLLENINHVLNGRTLDYLVINHLEPDHAACIEEIMMRWPDIKIISNEKAFMLMRQFGFPSVNTPSPLFLLPWFIGRKPWLHLMLRTVLYFQPTPLGLSAHWTVNCLPMR